MSTTSDRSYCVPLYAIRHKPTGDYIPRALGREGRGGSHLEPVEPTGSKETRPRFFETERAAKIFLSSWLKGKVVHTSGYDSLNGEYWEDTEIVPVPSRKAEDMEVVQYVVDLYTR